MNVDFKLLKLVIEHLGSVAIVDREGRYVYVNDNWVEGIGVSREKVLGKYVHDLFPNTKIDIALETGQSVVGEIFKGEHTKSILPISYAPLIEDNCIVGGIIYTIFKDTEDLLGYKQKLDKIQNQLEAYKKELKSIKNSHYTIQNIIGNSSKIENMKKLIYQASRSNSTVLIEGETGTGKELVAHSIHNLSNRNNSNFIKMNCAAIPIELFESELFGYEEGSFTGAKKGGQKGKFELANNGSIFFDEINQLSMMLQPKLLRALQEREIERVGGKNSIQVDVRIIAATNIPLEVLVEKNIIRNDLFYRLNVIKIKIPPLRERLEDIPLIIQGLINKLNIELGSKITGINPKVIEMFNKYSWPGNIRELQNAIERAMNIAWIGQLEPKHFNETIFQNKLSDETIRTSEESDDLSLKSKKNIVIKETVIEALNKSNGNKSQAAKLLGISRTVLYEKLKKYNIVVK